MQGCVHIVGVPYGILHPRSSNGTALQGSHPPLTTLLGLLARNAAGVRDTAWWPRHT